MDGEPQRLEDVVFGFPVYALATLKTPKDDDVLLVAGGGGPSKSGVRNALLAFARLPDGRVRRLAELGCGPEAPMCLAVAGQSTDGHAAPHLEGASEGGGETLVALGVNDRLWRVCLGARLSLQDSAQGDDADVDSHVRVAAIAGPLLATTGADGRARLWSWPSLAPLCALPGGPDLSLIYGHGGCLFAVAQSGNVSLYKCSEKGADLSSNTVVPVRGSVRFVRLLELSDGSTAILCVHSIGSHARASLFDARTRRERGGKWLPRSFRPTALSVCGREWATVGGADGSLIVFSLPKLHVHARIPPRHAFIVTSVSAVPSEEGDALLVYSASGDGTVRLLRVPTAPGRGLSSLVLQALFVAALAVLLYFLAGSDGRA